MQDSRRWHGESQCCRLCRAEGPRQLVVIGISTCADQDIVHNDLEVRPTQAGAIGTPMT